MKRDEIVYVSLEAVERLHAEAIDVAGGGDGYVRKAMVESAVGAAASGYHATLADIAAAYAHGIANGHGYLDGNKRTGFYAAIAFLDANGHFLHVDNDKWEAIMLSVAGKDAVVKMTREQLADELAREMGGDPGNIDD